jgi:hypothetical protein
MLSLVFLGISISFAFSVRNELGNKNVTFEQHLHIATSHSLSLSIYVSKYEWECFEEIKLSFWEGKELGFAKTTEFM